MPCHATPAVRAICLAALLLAPAGCGDSGKAKPQAKGGGAQTGAQVPPANPAGMSGEAPAAPAPAGPPVPVVLAQVETRDVPQILQFTGQTVGFEDIDIRARVQGYLKTMEFKEGGVVRKGDLLYTIDPAELQTVVARAKGDLASAEGLLQKHAADVARYEPLFKEGAVSRKELDDAIARKISAEGQVTAAKAALEKAELDLSYTKITAPADGLIGQTQVNVGNLVGRGENTLLATISVIDPIKVRVSISEADLLAIARRRLDEMKATGASEKPPIKPFTMTLADGSTYPHEGEFLTIDRAVDQTTGTMRFDVKFPNPDRLLRPGNFAKLSVEAAVSKGVTVVPQRAVLDVQGQSFVAVVGEGDRVELRRVKTGRKSGSDWVIDEGVKAGERIVVEGVNKVRDGTVVTVPELPVKPPAPAEGTSK